MFSLWLLYHECTLVKTNNIRVYLRLEATIVTTIEVVVEELCSRTVAKIPIIRFEMGLLRISLLENAFPAALPTTIL